MKRLSTILFSIVLLGLAAFGQQTPAGPPSEQNSYTNGVFYAPNFGQWSVRLASTITSGSTTVFNVDRATVSTPDGIVFVPFRANEKIFIGTGTLTEIATISSISGCGIAQLSGTTPQCAITLTGTTTNSHFASEPITSADSGIMEAIGVAEQTIGTTASGTAQNGGGTAGAEVYFAVDCGTTTLGTGALTTTTTCFVPNQFYNQGSASRVTTTITTSASWAVGIVNNTSGFSTANSTLTAGTTAYGFQGTPAVNLVTSATSPNLTAVLYTMGTSNPGAGAIKSKVWGYVAVQPAF